MNREVNEMLAGKFSGRPELVSAQAKELLNLRRLPAMLNVQQTAILLGIAEHDIPALIHAGLLKPLGDPPPNAVKYFASIQIMELAGEVSWLGKIRDALYEYWRHKNTAKDKTRRNAA
jgi:hypothetical protein